MRDLDDEGNGRDFSQEGIAKIVGHVVLREAAIVKMAVGKVEGTGKANAEQRRSDSNANAGWIDSGSNGNRVNDFVDEDITKVGHEVLVRLDIGARGRVDKEIGRIINRSCIEGVQLSGSIREISLITKADAKVGNRREISQRRHGGNTRRQESWGSDIRALEAQKQQQETEIVLLKWKHLNGLYNLSWSFQDLNRKTN
jgi:hypothetical protein